MDGDSSEIFKRLFVPVASALTAILGYRFLTSVDRPLLVGGSIVLGAGAFGSGGLLLRRLWLRRREHRRTIVEPKVTPSSQEAEEIKTLQSAWKEALRFLRNSRLKTQGNPLYVLPWYMVIGDAGAGKSTAIHRAGLSSFGEIKGSRHCEWSFFEQGIVMDVAGEYLAPTDTGEARPVWHALLDLLMKHRRRESLNGVVVTLSAEKLLSPSAEALEKEGRTLRKRVDEAMRALGAKFPVYLLVTQCDRVPGLTRFSECLSENGRRQPMGGLNQELGADAVSFLNKTMAAIGGKLKSLRLVIAGGVDEERNESELLLFPESLDALGRGLKTFVQSAFQENPYQETPFLRGLFFSGSGVFLNELFSNVIPADRWLFTPTRRALQWHKGTFTLGLLSWFICTVALGGVMTYSFLENLSLLREADREFANLPSLGGLPAENIPVLEAACESLLAFEAKQSQWLPSFGFHQVEHLSRTLEQRFSGQFRRQILAPADATNERAMSQFNARSSNKAFSQQIAHLVARVRLLRAKLQGADARTILSMPPPPDVREKFGQLYLISLAWSTDHAALSNEMSTLLAHLKPLLMLKSTSPEWIIEWANAQDSVPPVTLADYWGAGARRGGGPVVPAIFSKKDKVLIDSFFAEISLALGDPSVFNELHSKFEHWYRLSAFDAWRRFIADFPRGEEYLRNRDQWRHLAGKIASDESPYFRVVNDMASQLEPFAGSDSPSWFARILQFHQLLKPASPSTLSGLAWKYSAHSAVPPALPFETFAAYRKDVQKLAEATADRSQSVAAVAQAFNESAGTGSSYGGALDTLVKLKTSFPVENGDEQSVWKLVTGPFDFLWDGGLRDAGTTLQSEWETNVLAAAAGMKGPQASAALLAPEGPALRFARETAAPYVQWKPGRGFCAKSAFGNTLPLYGSLFGFLNQSGKAAAQAKVGNADVAITALAPETNAGAKRIPHATKLDLNCGGKLQTLANRRQRVIEKSFNVAEKQFNWSPACADTTLEIDVGDSRLIKKYPGAYGFVNFLRDFKDGTHVFAKDSFPTESAALALMGINTVSMHYKIQGAPDFSPSDVTVSVSAPTKIAGGWNE